MSNSNCTCPIVTDSFSAGALGMRSGINPNCLIHGKASRFTPNQVKCILGGKFPEYHGFNWEEVYEFRLMDEILQPYDDLNQLIPGPGIQIKTSLPENQLKPYVFIAVNGHGSVVITPNSSHTEESWEKVKKLLKDSYIKECIEGSSGRCEGVGKILLFAERHSEEWSYSFTEGISIPNWTLVE